MDTGNLWPLLLLVSALIFTAGCTTTSDTALPATTPLPAETVLAPRSVASSDLPDFDYAAVPVISPGASDWMTTNASYVARIALRDEAARAMYLGGGTVEGVLLSCPPFPSGGDGCAAALRIANTTAVVDFLVDETEGGVVTTVTEVRGPA